MDKLSNLALVAQMIDAAEKNIQTAKQLLREMMGGQLPKAPNLVSERLTTLGPSEGGKVIEGVFDGQNMIGPDNKQYPVPANYASKSKLVEGDVLKLTIAEDGSFIYKQIGPVERKKMIGILSVDDRGDYKVNAEGKIYKVLLASLTYFKAAPGDQVTIVVPEGGDVVWAAVENVIKSGQHADAELSGDVTDSESGETAAQHTVQDIDEEL